MKLELFRRSANAIVMREPKQSEYLGLTYSDLSMRGTELCRAAADTGCFKHLPAHLTLILRGIEQVRGRLG